MKCNLCLILDLNVRPVKEKIQKTVLQVKYMDKNIDDILNMTIDNAYDFSQKQSN